MTDNQPFRVDSVLVQRVPSSSAEYGAYHNHYWCGYLAPFRLPLQWIEKFGAYIEVRTLKELEAECAAYRARMTPEAGNRLAYYEVLDAKG